MVIKRKSTKEPTPTSDLEALVDRVINRGGTTSADRVPEKTNPDEVRFTLRLPSELIQRIDEARKARVGNISRNQWTVEALNKALEDTNKPIEAITSIRKPRKVDF